MIYASPTDLSEAARLDSLRAAGFSIVSLAGVYDGYDRNVLQISEENTHPTALGHRLIADRLIAELQRRNILAPTKRDGRFVRINSANQRFVNLQRRAEKEGRERNSD
jgi:hypothetical protein